MTYRQIHVEIWDDPWVVELSSDDKLLFIYLFSNSRTTAIGLYELSERTIAFDTGLSIDTIREGLQRFADAGKVQFKENWVWVPKLLGRNINNLRSPQVQSMIQRLIRQTPNSCPFKTDWFEYYNGIVAPQYDIDTISIGHSQPQIPSVSVTATDLHSVSESGKDSALDAYVKIRGGAVNPLDVDQVNDLTDELEKHRNTLPAGVPGADLSGDDWVRTAVMEANAARKGSIISLNYIKAILDRWRVEGFKARRDGDGSTTTTEDGRTVIKVQP